MKKHFKPEDRTLAYQVFYFLKARAIAEHLGSVNEYDRRGINNDWTDFTYEFDDFIKSDYNRDDFEFTQCVDGFLEEKFYKYGQDQNRS